MKPLHWLLVAIAGVALLYYVRRRQLVAHGATGNAPVPGNPLGTNNAPTASQGPTRYGSAGGTASTGSARDVAPADLEATGERDVFLDDWYWNRGPTNPIDDAIWAADWRGRFVRQVLQPAQALTAADLSPNDFKLAMQLLDGSLSWPPPPEELSDLQKRQKSLNDSDALADELYGVWKLVAQIAGTLTFGLTTIAATLIDQYGGANGQTIQQELDARNAVDAAVRGSLTGADVATLVKWIGPVPLIGNRRPSDWTPAQLQTVLDYLGGKVASGDTGAPPAVPVDHTGLFAAVPVYSRSQLFAVSRGGPYLRWNAPEIVVGKSFPERVNQRARILRAIDVIACQLFPYTEPELTPAGTPPSEPPGLYCYFNPLYRSADGKTASGWIKGSIFRPNGLDKTYEQIAAATFGPVKGIDQGGTVGGISLTSPPATPGPTIGPGILWLTPGPTTVGDPTGSHAAHRAM